MNSKVLLIPATFILLLVFGACASAQPAGIHYPSLIVYSNGYVQVKEYVRPENSSVVSIPLLGRHVEGVTVTSSNGTPVPFEIENGSIIAFPPAGVGCLNVSYYTPDLTVKRGIIWTVSVVNMSTPFWIKLPSNAVIVDMSAIPLQIHGNVLLMPKGTQNVSYILQYNTSTTATTSSGSSTSSTSASSTTPSWTSSTTETGGSLTSSTGGSGSSAGPSTTSQKGGKEKQGNEKKAAVVGGICAAAGAILVGIALSKRKAGYPSRDVFMEEINRPELDLNDDEKKALIYIYDRGGKVSQAEVREALELPKTTAWRMFRRLEEKGLIRIIKKRKGNEIELIWKEK